HGLTSQKPQTANKSTEDLEQTRVEFVINFWRDFAAYQPSEILNVDETAIDFDMPPLEFGQGVDEGMLRGWPTRRSMRGG
ncbi:hypothetical protein F443_23194, partial [Phytophthora nicotianae P1569]